jgi:hypothetical protein
MSKNKLNEEIENIKSLMSINEVMTLPFFGTSPTNYGTGQGIWNFFNSKTAPESSIFHRQTFLETGGKNNLPLGYFVPNMMVGKCYEYSKINLSDPVWKIMGLEKMGFVPGEDLFEDEDGAYIKPSKDSPIRIYLPKKEFFKQFSNCIFSIKKVIECDKPNAYENKTYTLLFQLKDPNLAIKTSQLTSKGLISSGNISSENRGWDLYSNFKSSGYFYINNVINIQESKNNKNNMLLEVFDSEYEPHHVQQIKTDISEEIITPLQWELQRQDLESQRKKQEAEDIKNQKNEKLTNLIANSPLNNIEEYSWAKIEEEIGRSDFDIWYDSSSGTLIVIGIQIILGILSGGIAAAAVEGLVLTAAQSAARRVAIVIFTELVIGVPEAVYLHGRGMDSMAGLILFMCLIPAFGELGRFNKFIKKPADFDKAINDLVRNNASGSMRTPAEFKQWLDGLKTLNPVLHAYFVKVLPLAAQTATYGTKAIERRIIAGLERAVINAESGNILTAYRLLSDLEKISVKTIPSHWKSTAKNLGFSLLVAGAAGIVFSIFFSSDTELGKPTEMKARVDKGITEAQRLFGAKIAEQIKTKIKKLTTEIDLASEAGNWQLFYDKTHELLKVYRDLCRIGSSGTVDPISLLSNTIDKSYQLSLLNYVHQTQQIQSGIIELFDVPPTLNSDTAKKKLIDSRPDLAPANGSVLKGKPDICEFLNWAYLNYNDKFEWIFYSDLVDKSTKQKQRYSYKTKGIFTSGGSNTIDPKNAVGDFLCGFYFNPINQNVAKWDYPDILYHPLIKSLWVEYGTLYTDFKNSSCNKPGFTEITKASEIGKMDDPNYEYCTFKDSSGKNKFFKKIKEKVEN